MGDYEVGYCKPPREYLFRPGHAVCKRPRPGRTITAKIKKILQQKWPDDPDGRTTAEVLAASLIANAIKGNAQAIKQIMDRVDGPIPVAVTTNPQDMTGYELVTKLIQSMDAAAKAVLTTQNDDTCLQRETGASDSGAAEEMECIDGRDA